jgi:hypothetical protein
MSTRPLVLALAALGPALLGGCDATCKTACERLLECDEVDSPRLPQAECEASCLVQEDVYDSWDDTQLQDAFGDFKSCLRDSECADIAAGACYDEDLFLW